MQPLGSTRSSRARRKIVHAIARYCLIIVALVACGEPQKPAPKKVSSGKPVAKRPKPKAAEGPAIVKGEQHGFATWYGGGHHGGPTASGERYNKRAMTAAHRTLPMNTRVRVTNKKNNRSVVLRINDRGPYGKKRERIIDVSEAAAEQLNMIKAGVVPVLVEILE